MMRVLHVTESMGAGTATAIGQYVGCADFSHALVARVRGDSFHREPWLESVPHVLVPTVQSLVRQWLRCRREPYDVVHAHSTLAGHLTRALPHPTARTVYSPHGLAAVHHRSRVVRSALSASERFLAGRASAFAAVGASEEGDLRSLAPHPPIVRLPHALPVRASSFAERTMPPMVCSVGRLTYQKAPDTVADLPRRLAEDGLEATWVWVGDGDADLRAGLERGGWRVTGWVDGAEVGRLLGSATVLLHPARYEGLSLAIVESLSRGTPVVARRIAPNEEYEGVRLFMTPDEAVAQVSGMLSDPAEWEELSRAGVAYVERAHGRYAQVHALTRLYGEEEG